MRHPSNSFDSTHRPAHSCVRATTVRRHILVSCFQVLKNLSQRGVQMQGRTQGKNLSTGATTFILFAWRTPLCRSESMPTADRDWRAKDHDRGKVDRLTRTFRPLADEVVYGHLVGDHTSG